MNYVRCCRRQVLRKLSILKLNSSNDCSDKSVLIQCVIGFKSTVNVRLYVIPNIQGQSVINTILETKILPYLITTFETSFCDTNNFFCLVWRKMIYRCSKNSYIKSQPRDEMHLLHFVLSVNLNSSMPRPRSYIYKHRGALWKCMWSSKMTMALFIFLVRVADWWGTIVNYIS